MFYKVLIVVGLCLVSQTLHAAYTNEYAATQLEDCSADGLAGDECEYFVKSEPPTIYSFCRNSNQNDAGSLKVCTFTNVNGYGYTNKTEPPVIQNNKCEGSAPDTLCYKTCDDLWGRGFHSTDSSNVFGYTPGKAFECTLTPAKLVCACSQLATLLN